MASYVKVIVSLACDEPLPSKATELIAPPPRYVVVHCSRRLPLIPAPSYVFVVIGRPTLKGRRTA